MRLLTVRSIGSAGKREKAILKRVSHLQNCFLKCY